MAVSYNDLWKKQKQSGVYQTRDGGKVYSSETTRQADKAVQAAVQSANQQKSSGTYKTTSGGTVKSTSSGSSGSSSAAANAYKALLANNTTPNLTYSAPTVSFTPVVQPAKTATNVKPAIAAVDGSKIAAEAYKRKLAANQRRTTNQGMYDDEERITKVGTGPSVSEATFGAMYVPGSVWVDVKKPVEKPENNAPIAPAVSTALVASVVEEPLLEEELLEEEEWEEELNPMEEYMQMILDAQNAQNAAQLQMLRNQSGVLNQQYDNNAAELYARYRRSGLMMPELMAGTATGIADSLTLQNDLNLQNNLAANELERAAAQNELNAQANQIQADADLQAAQTAAEWAKMAYQQRLANQNKGGGNSGNGGNGGNVGQQEGTTEPVAMMSSSQAIVQARQASNTYAGQIAFLQQLLANGQITPAQYSDLKMALDPTLSYK